MINEEQVQQVIDLVSKGVQKAAEALGVAVPALWEILIKQQYVEAAQMAILPIATAIGIFLYPRLWKLSKQDSDYDFPAFLGAIFLCCLTIASLFLIGGVVGRLINPEFYAIKDVICFAKEHCAL